MKRKNKKTGLRREGIKKRERDETNDKGKTIILSRSMFPERFVERSQQHKPHTQNNEHGEHNGIVSQKRI